MYISLKVLDTVLGQCTLGLLKGKLYVNTYNRNIYTNKCNDLTIWEKKGLSITEKKFCP